MAVAASAPLIKKFRSLLSAFQLSAAAAGAETLTLTHNLTNSQRAGVTPTEIRTTLRSLNVGSQLPLLTYQSANASVALFGFAGQGGTAVSAQIDFLCEYTTSIVR